MSVPPVLQPQFDELILRTEHYNVSVTDTNGAVFGAPPPAALPVFDAVTPSVIQQRFDDVRYPVTITGQNLAGVAVVIDLTPEKLVSQTDTSIEFLIDTSTWNVGTYDIRLESAAGNVTIPQAFTVTAP